MHRTCAHATLSASYYSAEGWVQSVWQNLAIMHFFAVFLGDSACNTKRMTMGGIQQGTGMWNLPLWWTIASQRDFRRKLNQSLDPMLVSNYQNVTYCYKRSIFLHFTLCIIRISKSTSSFPDRKYQYLVKFCRLFISFGNVRGTEH